MPTAELEKTKQENQNLEVNFAKLSIEEGLDILSTGKDGLSKYEVFRRIEAYGQNKIEQTKKKSKLNIFLSNFRSPLIYILLLSSIFALLIHKIVDAFVIFIVVLVNAIIGYIQERKAEKEIASLKKLTVTYVNVIRDKNKESIEVYNLVLGDVVLLEEGDRVPVDGRILESNNLLINESSLTGESRLVEKREEKLAQGDDVTSNNMVYQGTTVAEGRGIFFVTATGLQTKFGRIVFLADEPETETPLQKKMTVLSREIGATVLVVSLFILIVGILKGKSVIYMAQVAVSLAVSAIPEGLPIAITVILVLGAKRMAKRKAIVRNMMAVETLGTTTIIATDKTGTLTHNKLKVVEIFAGKKFVKKEDGKFDTHGEKLGHDFEKTLYTAAICTNAEVNDRTDEVIGEPTDVALMEAALEAGFIKKAQERLDEIPFSSNTKTMSVLVKAYSGCSLCVKGAPEEIIKDCEKIYKDGKVSALNKNDLKLINDALADMTSRGLRVIAVCFKDTKERKTIPKNSSGLIFLGLVGMEDTYREGVFDAIKKCKTAGIKIMMLTGDHLETALNIAKSLNIFTSEKKALLGQDIQTDKVGNIHLSQVGVFARILPEHKYKIIEMLKKDGEIVAMTGDGVNDVPALKKADIGIAMGISGTEAAKEAADIVLTDDNFSTIVSAVEEGRTIFENIRKTLTYLFSTSLGEVMTVMGSLFMGIPLPITPLQILWINLITDTSATIPLGMEEKEESHLQKPPRHPREHIISRLMVRRSLLVGVYMATFAILLFSINLHKGEDYARTITFLFLSISQWVNAFNCRSEKRSILSFNPFSNKVLLLGILLSFIAQIIVMYILPINIFGFGGGVGFVP